MKCDQTSSFFVGALSIVLLAAPAASAQYDPPVDPWYGGYYDRGIYDDSFSNDDWYEDYYDYGWQSPEAGVERVLEDPYAQWDYEPLGDEWEIESVVGEVEYDPEGYFAPSTQAEVEQAVRRELRGPGSWEYEPLQGEWEYETPAGDEVEYDPAPRF